MDRFTLLLHRALASPDLRRRPIADVHRTMTYGQLHSHAVLAAPPPGAASVTEATKLASFFDGAALAGAGRALSGADEAAAWTFDVDAPAAAAANAAAAAAAPAATDANGEPIGSAVGGVERKSEWSLFTSVTARRPDTSGSSLAQTALLAAARTAASAASTASAAGPAESGVGAAALVALVVAAALVEEVAGGAHALLHRSASSPGEARGGSRGQWEGESQCCGIRAANGRRAASTAAARALGVRAAKQAAWARHGAIPLRVRVIPIPPPPPPHAGGDGGDGGAASLLSRAVRRACGSRGERLEGDLITFGPCRDDGEVKTVAVFTSRRPASERASLRAQAAAAAATAAGQWTGDGAVAGYAVVVRDAACALVPHLDTVTSVAEVGLASLERAGPAKAWPHDDGHALGPVGLAVAAVAVWRRQQQRQQQLRRRRRRRDRSICARLMGRGCPASVGDRGSSEYVWLRAAHGDAPTAVRVRRETGGGSFEDAGTGDVPHEPMDLGLEVSLEETQASPAGGSQ